MTVKTAKLSAPLNHGASLLFLILFPLACGLSALLLGQDANWDLRNYHFYIPYAFLEGRLDWDVAPSHVANFYNPLLYMPFYYALITFPPKLFGFIIGAMQGLNALLLIRIGERLFVQSRQAAPRVVAVLLAVVGMTGAGFISEIGTTFADTILSLPVLGSLCLNLSALDKTADETSAFPWKQLLLSGFLMGMAAGLKQPTVIFAVGLCLAFLIANRDIGNGFWMAFVFGIGVLVGIGTTGGFWLYEMWSRYANPLFPYFNDVFRSPWGFSDSYRDTRFLPATPWEALIYPFYFVLSPEKVGEIPFRDFRLLLLYGLSIAYGCFLILGRVGKKKGLPGPPTRKAARYVFFFGVVTFLLWLKLFSIYRYLIVLEMLAPIGIWWLLQQFFGKKAIFTPIALTGMFLLIVTTQPGDWERVPWGNDYFGVVVPQLEAPEKTLVLMSGTEPMAYVIPFFPKPVRFLRIQSYFTGPSATPNRFDTRMQAAIHDHSGPIYILFKDYEKENARNALKAYGLALAEANCVELKPHIESERTKFLRFCPVTTPF